MAQLSSIAEIRMGATLRGRDATRPVPSGSVRFVRIGDISQDGELLNKNLVRIEPGQTINEELFLRPGDILFPNRGIRTTALVMTAPEPRTLAGAQFFIVRVNGHYALPDYVAWFLRTEKSAAYFDKKRKGSYVQILQRSDLAELEVPLPPLKDQETIVRIASLALEQRKLSESLALQEWRLVNNKLLKYSLESEQNSDVRNENH